MNGVVFLAVGCWCLRFSYLLELWFRLAAKSPASVRFSLCSSQRLLEFRGRAVLRFFPSRINSLYFTLTVRRPNQIILRGKFSLLPIPFWGEREREKHWRRKEEKNSGREHGVSSVWGFFSSTSPIFTSFECHVCAWGEGRPRHGTALGTEPALPLLPQQKPLPNMYFLSLTSGKIFLASQHSFTWTRECF